jgi:hypothetical protein
VLAGIRWEQQGGLPVVQRSAFTGRATQLDFGAAARWRAQGDVVPLWDDAQRADWMAFEAAAQIAGTEFRLPVGERSQYGALGNLLQNPNLLTGVAPWLTNGGYFRQQTTTVAGFAPSEWSFGTVASGSTPALIANNEAQQVATVGQRFFLGAWVRVQAGSTGDLWLFAQWFNGATPLTPTLVAGGVGGPDGWRRVTGFGAAPSGTTGVQFGVQNNLATGAAEIALPRASFLPEVATVNGASNAGRSLALSGLALSQRNLRAGQFITVTLPGGDEQLIRLAADLVADGSGNATASLTTPLRRTPAAGAIVELERPWGLMRLTNAPGWSVDSQNIYGHTLEAEEAF